VITYAEMVRVAFSPSDMGASVLVPRMPSSQPVQQHQSRRPGIPLVPEMRTSNDAANANRSDEVASPDRRIESGDAQLASDLASAPHLGRDQRDLLIALLVWCIGIIEPSCVHERCQGEGLRLDGAPVYSMATSSCFLGMSTPLPGLRTCFWTPMVIGVEVKVRVLEGELMDAVGWNRGR
jgi:hypothetical protein